MDANVASVLPPATTFTVAHLLPTLAQRFPPKLSWKVPSLFACNCAPQAPPPAGAWAGNYLHEEVDKSLATSNPAGKDSLFYIWK